MSIKIYGHLNSRFNASNSRNKWIRGMYTGQVALYDKRKRSCRLRRNDDQSITLIHWNTGVLTVYPDGRMEINTHFQHVSATTGALMNYVLRPDAYVGTVVHRGCRQQVFSFGPKKYFRFARTLTVIPDEEGGYRAEGNLPLLRRVMDRKATQEAREKLDEGWKVWLDMTPAMLAVCLRDYVPVQATRMWRWDEALFHASNEEYSDATHAAADACVSKNAPEELWRFIRRKIARMTAIYRIEEDV